MRLTMPQLIMLNHAAWVNSERMKKRWDKDKDKDKKEKASTTVDVEVSDEPDLAKMTSKEWQIYYRSKGLM